MAPRFAYRVGVLLALTSVAPNTLLAQNQITPGQPSLPFVGQAALNNPSVTYSYGIEFVTVNLQNNPAWAGDGTPNDSALGRGSVTEPFRMGRYEVTTAQWVQFFNAYTYVTATQGNVGFVQTPSTWGAISAPNPYGAGVGWTVPAGRENFAVGGISWRTAAIYCNWLCNNQALTRDAFMSGAYDVSTFGYTGPAGDRFTDQRVHSPGAAYFIPNYDQSIAATYYDPNRFGAGVGGYWTWANGLNRSAVGGPPGFGEANMDGWGSSAQMFSVPLGSYPGSQSPWGMLDTAGATIEWNETIFFGAGYTRYLRGSYWSPSLTGQVDRLGNGIYGDFPSVPDVDFGFRIAASVPAPGIGITVLLTSSCASIRRRTRQ